MKITINENPAQDETEIVLNCRQADEKVLRMLAVLRAYDQKLTGQKGDITFVLEQAELLYAESVDKRTFLYTADAVYESPLRLYQLEDALGKGFFRASKSTIINVAKIRSLQPDFSGRLNVSMQNGEHLQVSRQYVPILKQILGMR